jgi:hypothetical protein
MKQPRASKQKQYFAARLRGSLNGPPAHIGHNQGPALTRDSSWSSFCWKKTHREAWKTPPIEIVRLRCRRAASLGLTYRQYTAALMDRGVHLQAIVFALGGTLVRTENGHVTLDQEGRIQPLPGVLEKLKRLNACTVLVITNDAQARSIIQQLDKLCGGVISGHGVYGNGQEATSAIADLLAKFKLPAAAALMVGADVAGETSARAAKLAKFIPAREYFAAP